MKSLPSCKSSYQALPKEVHEEFTDQIKKENYKADISTVTRVTDKKATESFNQVYCDHYEREAFPRVLENTKPAWEKTMES